MNIIRINIFLVNIPESMKFVMSIEPRSLFIIFPSNNIMNVITNVLIINYYDYLILCLIDDYEFKKSV